MHPLRVLAQIFINTFGITQPGPDRTERAARFIGLLLLAVLLLLIGIAIALRDVFHHA